MNLKLNEEQIAYVNGLEDPEAKKDFLINCFIHQCEEEIKKEEVFDGNKVMRETNLDTIDWLHKKGKYENLNFDLPKNNREKFDKFIEDNGLKKFCPELNKNTTPPIHFWSHKGKVTSEFPKEGGVFLKKGSFLEKSLSKEQLKHITKPKSSLDYAVEYLGRSREDEQEKILEEVKEMAKYFNVKILRELPVEKQPRYTKEDLEKAFNESRLTNPIIGFKHNDFEEYFKTTQ